MGGWLFLWVCWVARGIRLLRTLLRERHRRGFDAKTHAPAALRARPKPAWVMREVMRLKALMRQAGCRLLADSFNRRFALSRKMTVGKNFVAETVRKYQYEIQVLRKKIKHAKPRPVPRNLVWGMDLTSKQCATPPTPFSVYSITAAGRR